MNQKLLRSPVALLTIGGCILLLFSFILWWFMVYENPYNVYWGMFENSLSSTAVTKHVMQVSNGTDLDQYLVTSYGPQSTVHALTTLTQSNNTVKTEDISTLTSDYVRYNSVQTNQKDDKGKPFNFASILGRWSGGAVANSADQSTTSSLFAQSSLGILGGNLIPVANLDTTDRQQFMQKLHDEVIFNTSLTKVSKTTQHGHPIYTYNVSIEPVAYVGLEKTFATLLGIHTLDNVDPDQYESEQPISVAISIDAWSHDLSSISYPDQQHQEVYSNFGAGEQISVPHATISGSTLQSLLSEIK